MELQQRACMRLRLALCLQRKDGRGTNSLSKCSWANKEGKALGEEELLSRSQE